MRSLTKKIHDIGPEELLIRSHLKTIMKAAIFAYSDVRTLPQSVEFRELCKSLYCVNPELFMATVKDLRTTKISFMEGMVNILSENVLDEVETYVEEH